MHAHNHFGPHTTLREIAETSAGGRRVFDSAGLDYCCEPQRTLADACEDVQAPVDEMLETIERAHRSGRSSDPHVRSRRSLRSLVALVERAHRRTREMMETIDDRLARLHDSPEGSPSAGVTKAFHALRAEVDSRMDREEHEILGRLDALADGGSAASSMRAEVRDLELRLRLAREHHASVGAALRRLRRASDGCRDPGWRPLRYELRRLDRQLVHQVFLENEVLFRRALAILAAHEGT